MNEPGEVLAWCTHQPSSLTWRIKQVLRWHQGAVQLLLFKGIRYTSFGGYFPTMWHRLYAFDQATYYLQARRINMDRPLLIGASRVDWVFCFCMDNKYLQQGVVSRA